MDDLTTLLHDAVEDVEPTDRLAEIRRQTRPRRAHRWYAVGGTVLATAAVIAAIALVGGQNRPKADDRPPVTSPSVEPSTTAGESAYAVYYLGQTPQGERLYREFRRAPGFSWTEIAIQLLTRPPVDRDYRTPWPAGAFETAKLNGSVIEVTLNNAALRDRPAGMSAVEAELAVQQVVYTVQAAAGDRYPVQFRWNGNPIDQVLGVPTSEPVVNEPQLDVLAKVSISAPDEGRVVEDSFSANGVASVFEGTILWELRSEDGMVVKDGFTTGTWDPERLTPWETGDIDVSGLAPGTYTFVSSESDPSGGTEGFGPTSDTRTITIR